MQKKNENFIEIKTSHQSKIQHHFLFIHSYKKDLKSLLKVTLINHEIINYTKKQKKYFTNNNSQRSNIFSHSTGKMFQQQKHSE